MPHWGVPHGTSKLFTSDFEEYEAFVAEFGDENATFIGDPETGIGLGDPGFSTADYETWQKGQGYVDTPPRTEERREFFTDDNGQTHTTIYYTDGSSETFVSDAGGNLGDPVTEMPSEIPGHPDYEATLEFRTLKSGFLSELSIIGLDTDTIDQLWDWVESRFVADESFTSAQAMVEIYEQEAFKRRFPGITTMRQDTGRRDIPTPGEYLARERWLGQKFEQYGLTALGANLDNLVSESYMNTIGTAELEERLQGASEMIFEAPEEIKNTFGRWYGPHGDAALMAAFLDPEDTVFGGEWKNWGELKGGVAAAEVGGWSKMLLDLEAPITQGRAERISKLGLNEREIWSRFSMLKEQEDLFSERITETIDLDLVTTGVESMFNLSQDATDLLRRRQETRAAEFQGAGGALLSGTTTGFGAANA